MAELAILSATIQAVLQVPLEKALSLASEQLITSWGFNEEVEKLNRSFEMVQAFLHDVGRRQQVGENSVKIWLKSLETLAYDADIVLDKIQYETLRLNFKIPNKIATLFWRYKIVKEIRAINNNLKEINEQARGFGLQGFTPANNLNEIKSHETVSHAIDRIFVGRDEKVSQIVEILTIQREEALFVLSIVGMGGLGKTSLARKVYYDPKIDSSFEKRIWVSVSNIFDAKNLFELMLEDMTSTNLQLKSEQAILNKLQEELSDKRYLLVLDDVWNEKPDLWQSFRRPLEGITKTSGSCILITTRRQTVSSVTAAHHISLDILSDEYCWSILKQRVFGTDGVPTDMEIIGKKIANKCKGLPLAAQLVGGVLQNQGKGVWLSTLETMLSKIVDVEDALSQIFKLSCDRLPSPSLKRCFVHCSIFPKDYELVKEVMVQLWMAEGLLHSQKENLEMEDMGNDYFRILVQSSLLQDIKKDMYGNIKSCYMHDLVHDFAHDLLKPLIHSFGYPFNKDMKTTTYVRTLVLEEYVPDDMLVNVKCLRALILKVKVMALPTSIGKFIHLRYLDLSMTGISELPNFVCKLYLLQTLRLPSLRKLPNGMTRLVSLRHLYLMSDDFESTVFPSQIGRLTCLRTLNFFNASTENGCQFEELDSMQNLGGEMRIINLQFIRGREQAQKGGLKKKSSMHKLEYFWSDTRVQSDEEQDESVLDGLEPHPNLKSLTIENYLGAIFPEWVKVRLPQNLVELKLHNCNSDELPSLGHLKFLEDLWLVGFHKVECMGPTFYGVEVNNDASSSCSANIQVFPALKSLVLRDMPSLTEWAEAEPKPATNGGDRRGGVRMFPALEVLVIEGCPLLKTTPDHFEILRELQIDGVDSDMPLLNICSNLDSLVDLSIKSVEELTCLPDEWLHKNKQLADLRVKSCPKLICIFPYSSSCDSSLKHLKVSHCKEFRELPQVLYTLHSLEELVISHCPNFCSIPVPNGPRCLTSLRRLSIVGSDWLSSLPSGMLECSPSLEYLRVWSCDKLNSIQAGELSRLTRLRDLSIGPFSKSMDFDTFRSSFNGIQQLSSLDQLDLNGQTHWISLPDQIMHLSALTSLTICLFGIEALPDGLCNLTSLTYLLLYNCQRLRHLDFSDAMPSLRYLSIGDCQLLEALSGLHNLSALEDLDLNYCRGLERLPSRDTMQRLTKLKSLTIQDCPLLEKSCRKLIKVIPHITINGSVTEHTKKGHFLTFASCLI